MQNTTRTTVLFTLVVVFCIGLVAWWVIFQVRETERLEELGRLIPTEKMDDAHRILARLVRSVAADRRVGRLKYPTADPRRPPPAM